VGGGPAAEACVATLTIASSDSYAIQKHNAASGSSAISASTSAHVSSLPRFAVITSNHASQSRVVPAIAAIRSSQTAVGLFETRLPPVSASAFAFHSGLT